MNNNSFDSLKYGSFVHFILENILRLYFEKKTTNIDLQIKEYIFKFFEENDLDEKNNSFFIDLLFENLKFTIKNLLDEFKQSKFRPKFFEAKIFNDGNLKPLKIRYKNNLLAKIIGKIDRIDIMKSDNFGEIVRIVDYKTGTKKFNFTENLFGLDLQMVIYMTTVLENFPKVRFGGILYKPVNKKTINFSQNGQKNKELINKNIQMNGLYPKYHEIILGMEENMEKKFISVNNSDIEKNKDSLVTFEEFDIISSFAKKKILSLVMALRSAKFNPNPINLKIGSNVKNACEHCDFKKICLFDNNSKAKNFKSLKKNEILGIMKNGDINFGNKKVD